MNGKVIGFILILWTSVVICAGCGHQDQAIPPAIPAPSVIEAPVKTCNNTNDWFKDASLPDCNPNPTQKPFQPAGF